MGSEDSAPRGTHYKTHTARGEKGAVTAAKVSHQTTGCTDTQGTPTSDREGWRDKRSTERKRDMIKEMEQENEKTVKEGGREGDSRQSSGDVGKRER